MDKELNVLSLFGGMEVGYMALKDAGYKIKNYYSAEIDKYAVKQTKYNFNEIINLGDVNKINLKKLPKIDLLIGGSPCQGFSFAGKQLAFDDPRSALFFEFIRIKNILQKENPELLFLLENVEMKKEYLRIISEYIGLFPQKINSNLVSAQNRKRYYWSNIRTKKFGLFNELYTDIPEPDDKKIFLIDIIENKVDDKYYINNESIKRGIEKAKGKIYHTGKKMGNMDFPNDPLKKSKTISIVQIDGARETNHIGVLNFGGDLRPVVKSSCLDANYSKGIDNNHQRTVICVGMRGINIENGKRKDYKGAPTVQQLEPNFEGKTNCITTVHKDNLIIEDIKVRRLTPTECSRLQTIPNFYQWIVSETQQYKMLGNGWTYEIIKHIFSFING